MSNPMQFKHNQQKTYISTRTFTMGSDGVTIPEGSEIQFDGTYVSYSGLAPTMMPQLRGAIRTGWLIPKDEFHPGTYSNKPVSAGVKVRPADGGNPVDRSSMHEVSTSVESEEREVGNVEEHATATREQNKVNYRRERFDEREVPGVKFSTPAGKRAKESTADVSKAGSIISQTSKVKISPGRGRTRDELIREAVESGVMSQEELEEYQLKLDLLRSSYLPESVLPQAPTGVKVATPTKIQKEGFDITNSAGGGVEIADAGGTGGTAEVSVAEAEGIKFTNTNGPKKATRLKNKPRSKNASADDAVCRKVAKAICPDFPDNYVFTDSSKKKLARLQADFEDRPDVIRAVAAAETDAEVKRQLVEEFPEAFS